MSSSSVSGLPELSPRAKDILQKLKKFIDEKILPSEEIYEKQMSQQSSRWMVPPIMEGKLNDD